MKYDLCISIALFNPKLEMDLVKQIIDSIYSCSLTFKLYLIDNSPNDELRCLKRDDHCEYIFNNKNIGFGNAHNMAMLRSLNEARYHLVLNPDVLFDGTVLRKITAYMDADENIGLLMPMIVDRKSDIQYMCKRLPSPSDLILRRLQVGFLNRLFKKKLQYYEMKDMDYHTSFEAPYLSGCFMFFRTACLKNVGLFDSRFFMYMEDLDLSRRMYTQYKNVYYPSVQIFHKHARDSYRFGKLLLIHIQSAIKYFNKWGWFNDVERKKLNKSASAYSG